MRDIEDAFNTSLFIEDVTIGNSLGNMYTGSLKAHLLRVRNPSPTAIRTDPTFPNFSYVHIENIDMDSPPGGYPLFDAYIGDIASAAGVTGVSFTNCIFPK